MGALDGIKVLEAGLLVQGPQAAALLGDWGADVAKIELPMFGDQSRWLPIAPGDDRVPYFIGCNRGKRSITIDLRVDAGRETFFTLAAEADVFISYFTSGTLDEWGLSYEAVSARNPRIIYAAGTSFGTDGRRARLARGGHHLRSHRQPQHRRRRVRSGAGPAHRGVLLEAGLSWDDIADLRSVGAI